jgi:hypothetical protein
VARRRQFESTDDGHGEVIAWYRRELEAPAVFPWAGNRWEPVRIGPTWQTDAGRWVLPDATLGWAVLGWCGTNLQHGKGRPWRFTLEQARLILWWFAVDAQGRWLYRDAILQRLKGWGKDPWGACLCSTEAFGPARFADWDNGLPVATDVPDAWVQTAATSLEQTKNTMRLFPSLFTAEARSLYKLQIGKELVHGLHDTRLIQAVTSSPTTLEGARSSFVLLNETQHWGSSNEGHEMAAVIRRNAAKSEGGRARTLRITNAFEPGEDSVAEQDREAWSTALAGDSLTTGILYDSLEAPPDAPLTAEDAPEIVAAVRGDSHWLDVAGIVAEILDTRNPPSRSRRFWFNQITATEDAWLTPAEWDAAADPSIIVAPGAVITLGFDGSLSDDHTALIGCDVEQDHLFEIEVFVPEKGGEIDRAAVDRMVRASFDLYDVVGFYGDVHPFESYIDTWATDFGADLVAKASQRHPVAWDMRSRTQQFTGACERLHDAIVTSAAEATAAKQDDRPPGQRLTHCGSERFRRHAHNARRAPNKWGISVRKEHRESSRKIDSVPAATLARLARADYLALPESRRRRKKRTGILW